MEEKVSNPLLSGASFNAPSSMSGASPSSSRHFNSDARYWLDHPVQLLLLEDDKADQHIIETYLSYARELYFSPVLAQSLSEARELLVDLKIDAALMDYNLLDGTGIELAKDLSLSRCTPVVLVSDSDTSFIEQEMHDAGLYDFIPKMKMNPMLLEKVLKLAIIRSRQLRLSMEEEVATHHQSLI